MEEPQYFHYAFENLKFLMHNNHRYRLVRISYPPGRGYAEHYPDYFCFFVVLSGVMRYRLNGQERLLHPGTLQLVLPGDRQRIDNASAKENLVFINADVANDEMNKKFLEIVRRYPCRLTDCIQTVTALPEGQWQVLCNGLFKLIGFNNSSTPESIAETSLWNMVLSMVLNAVIQRSFSQEKNGGEPLWLENAFHKMLDLENFAQGIPRFLELCGKTHEHVCRAMREYYGITPQTFVNNLRLEYVADQLWKTSESITLIAYRSGFNNLAYFRRCFEKKYQISPREYRNRRFS